MEPRQSSFLNMVLTLTIVSVVAAVALGFVYKVTKAPIEKALLDKQMKAVEAVISGYDNNPVGEKYQVAFEGGKDSMEVYPAKLDGELVGMAVKTKSPKGYSGDIWLMVGFQKDGKISNIVVTEHLETPGLGSKMTGEKFISQFVGKDPGKSDLKVKKDGGDIDAISGATISSRAFSEAVLNAYKIFVESDHGKQD